MPKGLAEKAESLAPKLSRIRRQIHMYPELAYQEKRTADFVAKTLRQAGHRSLPSATFSGSASNTLHLGHVTFLRTIGNGSRNQRSK